MPGKRRRRRNAFNAGTEGQRKIPRVRAMNPPAPSSLRTSPALRWLPWAAALAVILGTLAAYSPVFRAGFIWDDDGHVTRPALQGLSGLGKIWTQLGATQQYYPVLHTAFWLEHRAWGYAPGPYHVTNILAHSIAACLLALLVETLLAIEPRGAFRAARNRWLAAWGTAVLFALHPMGVESVAWISEQKNTLSAVFGLGSALVYLRCGRSGRGWGYAAAFLVFAAAILTKSVTVTLPAVLLVLLWWREGHLERRDLARLLPWLLVGAVMGSITAWVERTYIGANGVSFTLSAASKVALAGRIAWFYAATWVWPRELLFVYPRWSPVGAPREWIGTVGVLGVIGLGFAWRRRNRGPLAATLLFLGILFPALGFFNVYPFIFSYVADHFAYLATAVLDAGLAIGVAGWMLRDDRRLSTAYVGVIAAIAAVCAVATYRDAKPYVSAETLYRRTLVGNPNAWLAHGNLATILLDRGAIQEAIVHLKQARELNPLYPEPANNLANAYSRLRDWDDALPLYAEAIRLRPTYVDAYLNWGNALGEMGRYAEAVDRYRSALALRPDSANAYYRLGNAYGNSGDLESAMKAYERAAALNPAFAEAEANWGLALAQTGRVDEAVRHLLRAVALNDRYGEAHAYLGFAYGKAGRLADAIEQYEEALRVEPDVADVHYNLAVALRAAGRLPEADAQFEAAARLGAGR
jgi:tetratricopeptide (TPR) repeat protein